MTNIHRFEDAPHGQRDLYLLVPECGNALVISHEEVRAKGVDCTGFRFPMYNVRDYERLPRSGESLPEWKEAARPRSNLTDRSGSSPTFLTYPDVKVSPPLRSKDDVEKALGIVGAAYVQLQQDPTATPNIVANIMEAGIPFEQLTVELTTFNPPQV